MTSDPSRLRGIAVHFGPGEDVQQGIAAVLAEHALVDAFVVAHGTLQEVELRDFEQRRTFATPSRVVAFDGRATTREGEATLRLAATVVRPSPRGPEFGSGEVGRAIAQDLEVLITALLPAESKTFVGSEGERSASTRAVRSRPDTDERWSGGSGAASRPSAPPEVVRRGRREVEEPAEEEAPQSEAPQGAAGSWAAAAAASLDAQREPPRGAPRGPSNFFEAQRDRDRVRTSSSGRASTGASVPSDSRSRTAIKEPSRGPTAANPLAAPVQAPVPPARKGFEDSPYPEEGDLVEHFAFGTCEVLRSDGDELVIRDPQSGRAMSLRLGVLQISGPVVEADRKVYRLRRRGAS